MPDQIAGETLAGRITVFVGEGDSGYPGCWFIVNDVPLDDGTGYSADNVWNSTSRGLTVPGVDIDHFDITWSSGILSPGDTSVRIDIPTGTYAPPNSADGFSMTYMILSFRSETTTGGTLSYLVE